MFATVDLPEPDSPTIASVVPFFSEKLTSSTALNISVLRGSLNSLVRWSTLMTVSPLFSEDSFTACSITDFASPPCSLTEMMRCEARDGAAATNRFVYGCCGCCSTSRDGPDSTTCPLYITTMCWARSAARPRSWVMNSTAVPRESVSMCRWSRIFFCTVTSSADVGSSAISSSGRHARPMAISARWRMPPENSCGYWRARVAASGRPASDSSPAMRSSIVEPTTYFLARYQASSSFRPALISPSATRQRVSEPGTHSSANRAMAVSSLSPDTPSLPRASLAAFSSSGSSLEPRKVSSSSPLSSTSSPANAVARDERFSWPMSMLLATKASFTCAPMRHTGLRLLIGSCGTRPILEPRSLSYSFCLSPEISWPSSLMEPPTTWPVPGSNPSTAMAEVDLPEPDSPTMATHCPG